MKPSPETTAPTATSSRSASTTTTTTTTTTTVSFLSNLMQDLFKYTILGFAGGLGFQLSLYCMQVRQQRSSDEQCRSSSAEVPTHKQHITFFSSSDIMILKKNWGNLDVSAVARKSVFWVRSLFCHGRSFLFGDSDGNGEYGGNESVSPEKKLFEDEEEETERTAAFATPQQKSKTKEVRLQQHEQRYRSGSIGSIGTVASQKDESNQSNNNKKTSSSIPNSSGRYLEILVHNIAHTDLVLSLGSSCDDDKEENTREDQNEGSTHHHYGISSESHNKDWILCRPRFSAFSLFSERILQSLLSSSNTLNNDLGRIISFPKYERNETSPRYSLVTPRVSRRGVTPVGLDLSSSSSSSQKKEALEVGPSELASLRVRGRDLGKVPEMEEIMKWWRERDEKGTNTDTTASTTATNNATHSKNRYHINAVFFPLLSTLIGRWQESIKQKYSKQHNVKKVVILISGKGIPRNWTHSIHGNSTQFCADLMEIFLKQVYNNSGMGDDITVVK